MDYMSGLANIMLVVFSCVGALMALAGLPGTFLIFLSAFLYGWWEGFTRLNGATLLILAVMWLGGELLELLAGAGGARKEKASWWTAGAALIGSVFGGIMGTGVFPLVGTVVGALLGGFAASFAVEYIRSGNIALSHQVALGAAKGYLAGLLIKFALAIAMLVVIFYTVYKA